MKSSLLVMASLALCAGCLTPLPNERYSEDRRRAEPADDPKQLHMEVEALRVQVELLEKAKNDLYDELAALRNSCEENHALSQTSLETLRKDLAASTVDRERMKSEIVSELAPKIQNAVSALRPPVQPARTSATHATEAREHTVQPGETLSAIASAYKSSIREILDLNKMKDANMIRPGQKLLIPVQE